MNTGSALPVAVEIGDRLLADERRDGDRLPWAYRLGDQSDEELESVRTVGDSLYEGTSGIVHFLLALHGVTHDRRYLEAAARAGEGMMQRYRSLGPPSPGLYIGQAGPALTLLDLSAAGLCFLGYKRCSR